MKDTFKHNKILNKIELEKVVSIMQLMPKILDQPNQVTIIYPVDKTLHEY